MSGTVQATHVVVVTVRIEYSTGYPVERRVSFYACSEALAHCLVCSIHGTLVVPDPRNDGCYVTGKVLSVTWGPL